MPLPITKELAETKYRHTFNSFDKDGNGEIDCSELIQLMRAIGQNPSKAEAEEMIHEVDEDGSGTISFEEFILLLERHGQDEKTTEEQLRSAFRVFDKDKDGLISAVELKEVLINFGEKMTDDEVEDMLAEADIDGNGLIDYEEFVTMMTKEGRNA